MRQRTGIDCIGAKSRQNRTQSGPAILVEHQVGAGSGGELWRNVNAEILKQADDIAAPTRCDGGRAEGVLENEVPANDPGEELAESGVAVGIGRAGNGNQRGKLGVAEPREDAADAGKNEGDDNRGAGEQGGSGTGEDEDAGADDGSNAQRRFTGPRARRRLCSPSVRASTRS